MKKTELILQAKELDIKLDCNGVIELLGGYVKEFPNDIEALALYQKNFATKTAIELNTEIENLYAEVVAGSISFNGISEENVIPFLETILKGFVAKIYLSDEEKKEILANVFMGRIILALGERLNDYETLKNQLDKFFEIVYMYGFSEKFYNELAFVVEWRSKVSENILRYLKEKAETLITIKGYEDIYNDFVKDSKVKNTFPYSEKPVFNGLLNDVFKCATNIKTQEQKDFWTECYAYQKTVREEEYKEYKTIIADKKHRLHGVYSINKDIHDSWMNALMKKTATSEEVANMQVNANCTYIKEFSESKYKTNIQDAERLYNGVTATPLKIVKILDTIKGFFN